MTDESVSLFWNQVKILDPAQCWVWEGSRDGDRYGHVWINGKRSGAHRMAFKLYWGVELPRWLYVCHECDNPACCNPNHLFLGLSRDNIKDAQDKGRFPRPRNKTSRNKNSTTGANFMKMHPERAARGELNGNAKLKESEVRAIMARLLAGETRGALAREFSVSQMAVRKIRDVLTWAHLFHKEPSG